MRIAQLLADRSQQCAQIGLATVAGEFRFASPLSVEQSDVGLQLILETGGTDCQRLSCTHLSRAEGECCWELAQPYRPAGDFVFGYGLGARTRCRGAASARSGGGLQRPTACEWPTSGF